MSAGAELPSAEGTALIVAGLDEICVFVATLIGYVGVAIMTYGAFKSFVIFLRSLARQKDELSLLRVDLGKHLALGLEFLVGKDIIESIVRPTWDDLGKLGAIIAVRTVLQLFLARELRELEEELRRGRELHAEHSRAEKAPPGQGS
jgi:uncharacterized membrane protein